MYYLKDNNSVTDVQLKVYLYSRPSSLYLQCGEEEIKGAYRRQSRLFHPDRHCDANKESAELNFQKIKRAYEGMCILQCIVFIVCT